MIDETGPSLNSTFAEALAFLGDLGASLFQMTGNDNNDVPVYGIIVVRGEGTKEIMDAISAIEARWDKEESHEEDGEGE